MVLEAKDKFCPILCISSAICDGDARCRREGCAWFQSSAEECAIADAAFSIANYLDARMDEEEE